LRDIGDSGDAVVRADALERAASIAGLQADLDAAGTLQAESLAIRREVGDQRGIANSLWKLGQIIHMQGDPAAARPLYEESLALRRGSGRASTYGMGILAFEQGDYASARPLLEESLAARRELGNRLDIVWHLEALAALSAAQGQTVHAARIWGAAERLRED